MLLAGADEIEDQHARDLNSLVLIPMKDDEVKEVVMNDYLICHFGKVLLRKLGERRKYDISARMRALGRMMIEIKDDNPDLCLNDVIGKNTFDKVVHAVELLSGLHQTSEGTRAFNTPSLPMRLGNILRKICQIKRGLAIRAGNSIEENEANCFDKLMDGEWADSISSIAQATLKTNKFNKPELLPVTQDLVKLRDFQQQRIGELLPEVRANATQKLWRELARTTLSRVILFNKRRGSEGSKLLIERFSSRPNWESQSNAEVLSTLGEAERVLLKR